jgi:hypothetical protein
MMNHVTLQDRKSRLQEILSGSSKPKSEDEGVDSMLALMWKKTFETALRSTQSVDEDQLLAPQAAATRDLQATVFGIEAASAMSTTVSKQLNYVRDARR